MQPSSLAPCRLVRQERQFERLQPTPRLFLLAPCRLARQVRQFERLQPTARFFLLAPMSYSPNVPA